MTKYAFDFELRVKDDLLDDSFMIQHIFVKEFPNEYEAVIHALFCIDIFKLLEIETHSVFVYETNGYGNKILNLTLM